MRSLEGKQSYLAADLDEIISYIGEQVFLKTDYM